MSFDKKFVTRCIKNFLLAEKSIVPVHKDANDPIKFALVESDTITDFLNQLYLYLLDITVQTGRWDGIVYIPQSGVESSLKMILNGEYDSQAIQKVHYSNQKDTCNICLGISGKNLHFVAQNYEGSDPRQFDSFTCIYATIKVCYFQIESNNGIKLDNSYIVSIEVVDEEPNLELLALDIAELSKASY